jgi:hypothetical protein
MYVQRIPVCCLLKNSQLSRLLRNREKYISNYALVLYTINLVPDCTKIFLASMIFIFSGFQSVLCLECGGESVDTDIENPRCSHCTASLYPLSTVKDTEPGQEEDEGEETLFDLSI